VLIEEQQRRIDHLMVGEAAHPQAVDLLRMGHFIAT
jgi:hypothetical protein